MQTSFIRGALLGAAVSATAIFSTVLIVDKKASASRALTSSGPLDLWATKARVGRTEINGTAAVHFKVDPKILNEFYIGQQVNLTNPLSGDAMLSKIHSRDTQQGGREVWKASIEGGVPQDNIIVTQDEIETYVVVSTTRGSYTAVIDNETGQTRLLQDTL